MALEVSGNWKNFWKV